MMSASTQTRSSRAPAAGGRILIVEDEPELARAYMRVLRSEGLFVELAPSPHEGLARLDAAEFDAVLSDVSMPQMDGLDLVSMVRATRPDLPVVLVTGQPTLDNAIKSLEIGAFRYLVKPVDPAALCDVMRKAVRHGREARLQRRTIEELIKRSEKDDHQALSRTFAAALDRLFMVAQPVVSVTERKILAYEALVRSRDPAMPHPGALFDAAERLSAHHDLGRAIRSCIARDIVESLPEGTMAFINVHPEDLVDDTLYDPMGPLAPIANRTVLELTERGTIETVADLPARVARLRELGFRIAIDDLGAGYAGLSTFARLEPEVAKLDMSLVRNVHREPTKRRLIQSIGSFCADMGILLVCEGVETRDERDALLDLGCDVHQGYLYAKPAAPFPPVELS
jgi:EAL domain-containing protein (putative c-di-GMP-specific phosphodiesterase class I)